MSGPRDFSVDLLAATASRIEARGRFFGIIEAPTAALDVQFDSSAPLRRGPGGSILLQDYFSRVTLTSALAQTVRVLIADEAQDVSNVVTGGGGGISLTVAETPSTAVASPAADVINNAAALVIAANAARLRLTISALSTNTGSVFVQATGAGAGRGVELQPGIVMEFRTRAALDVRNDSGAAQTVMRFEET